jgi:hypothetical protein
MTFAITTTAGAGTVSVAVNSDKVCSLLPTMMYRAIGGDVSGIPDLAAPAEVVQVLGVRFEIEG